MVRSLLKQILLLALAVIVFIVDQTNAQTNWAKFKIFTD